MGTLLPSFQDRLMAAFKDAGLVPMSAGITKPTAPASSYGEALALAQEEVDRANATFGSRTSDRFSTDVGNSYRDKRFELIKGFESLKTKAYPDAGGTSIGLGFHFDKPGARDVWDTAFGGTVDFDDAKSGKVQITTAQAKNLFDHDIVQYEKILDAATKGRATPLTQNQRLAMISVTYNAPSRVLDMKAALRAGDDAAVMDAILTKSFNPKNANLLKPRRYSEARLFASPTEASSLLPDFSAYNAMSNSERLASIPVSIDGTNRNGLAITDRVSQFQSGARTRRAPISDKLHGLLNAVGTETGVHFEVMSGGQNDETGYVGSTRHDHGGAADVKAYKIVNGQKQYLDMSTVEGQKAWGQIVTLSRSYGATGIGAGEGYMGRETMHIGFQGADRGAKKASTFVGVWGDGGNSASAPQWLKDSWEAGAHLPPMDIPNAPSTSGSSDTRSIQSALAANGFNPGPIDGVRGAKTDAAIKAFQKANGLTVDGIVGSKTLAALAGSKNVPSAATTADRVNYLFDTPSANTTASKTNAMFDAAPDLSATGGVRTITVRPDGTEVVNDQALLRTLPPNVTLDPKTGKFVSIPQQPSWAKWGSATKTLGVPAASTAPAPMPGRPATLVQGPTKVAPTPMPRRPVAPAPRPDPGIEHHYAPVKSAGERTTVTGDDMAFMPIAVQTSDRWNTGY